MDKKRRSLVSALVGAIWAGARHAQDVLGLFAMHDDWGQMSTAIGNLYAGLNLDVFDAIAFTSLAVFLAYPWARDSVARYRSSSGRDEEAAVRPLVDILNSPPRIDRSDLLNLIRASAFGKRRTDQERIYAEESGDVPDENRMFSVRQEAARFVREHPEAVSDDMSDVLVVRRWLDQQIQRELGLWD